MIERRPHQVEGLAALEATYRRTDRAQLVWACGTGKTYTGRWLAEDMGARLVLVALPSLALVAQTLAGWQDAGDWAFDPLVVCSDPTAADAWRVEGEFWQERHTRVVTTDSAPVTNFLASTFLDRPRVVFSTYHSLPVVARACRMSLQVFDLMVCDEAHRLAGEADPRFQLALDDNEIPAGRRLFMTATPVHAQDHPELPGRRVSMSDVAVFGPVAHRVDLARAIADGLLVDYQVVVVDASAETTALTTGQAVPAALAAAAREGLSRVLSFHGRVANARGFVRAVDGLELPDGRQVRATTVAGTDPIAYRREVLAELAAGGDGVVRVVANARCLAEGVDVPAVDGVIFADPKQSDTDIVQAIGRALRPAPGKLRGLVVIPVTLDGEEDADTALSTGRFAAVWAVLRALRNLDGRMNTELVSWSSRTASGPPHPGMAGSHNIRFELPGHIDVAALVARLVAPEDTDAAWDAMCELLHTWARQHGHTVVPLTTEFGGRYLGRWLHHQRKAYQLGGLATARVLRLQTIPHWAWTPRAAYWHMDAAVVATVAGTRLDLEHPDIDGAQFQHRTSRRHGMTVGRWCAEQRLAHRRGDLDDLQVKACAAIPGWSWDAGIAPRDQDMLDALAEWVLKYGDANVPAGTVWSGPLGAFVAALRRRRVTDRLTRALAAELTVITPIHPAPGSLDWQITETRWGLNLLALRQFAARTGGCAIPSGHREQLPDYDCELYQWTVRQRHARRHGELEPEREQLLEQVPGWTWERVRAARVQIGIGARQHGTRAGYAAGCLCQPCTTANTTAQATRAAAAAAGLATTDLVAIAGACAHLRLLEGQVGRRARPAMQQITGFNKKTIDEVINGTRARISPETDTALRALTAKQLRDHIEANPSPRDDIPAEPTLAILEQLIDLGWPKSWISREIGSSSKNLQVARGGTPYVRRSTADAVADLHRRIAGRSAPPPRYRAETLPLAELYPDTVRQAS